MNLGREQETAEGVIEKAGRTLAYRHSGMEKILTLCKKPCCLGKPDFERFSLLPCACHGMVHECTCKLKDKQCRFCKKVYLRVGKTWYEVDDPHPPKTTLQNGKDKPQRQQVGDGSARPSPKHNCSEFGDCGH